MLAALPSREPGRQAAHHFPPEQPAGPTAAPQVRAAGPWNLAGSPVSRRAVLTIGPPAVLPTAQLPVPEKNPVLHVGRLFKDTSYQDSGLLARFAMHQMYCFRH